MALGIFLPRSPVNRPTYYPGNKRIALIGDALLRLAIVEQWFTQGTPRGKTCDQVGRAKDQFFNIEECQELVSSLASNRNLAEKGHQLDIDQSVFKNPCQGGNGTQGYHGLNKRSRRRGRMAGFWKKLGCRPSNLDAPHDWE
ncbi:Hypothetical protein R9X50_00595900 [Acrodontium crateriforme]|uniref:RNase III domain-containing protein n=1 Tax=Acrodontium crateriforme TaxID=150365 RepID=A0AAQ3M817_9PEZI|nr:Hypothetical protein R9X50_00595900 [Acrodontium crateriforme]